MPAEHRPNPLASGVHRVADALKHGLAKSFTLEWAQVFFTLMVFVPLAAAIWLNRQDIHEADRHVNEIDKRGMEHGERLAKVETTVDHLRAELQPRRPDREEELNRMEQEMDLLVSLAKADPRDSLFEARQALSARMVTLVLSR